MTAAPDISPRPGIAVGRRTILAGTLLAPTMARALVGPHLLYHDDFRHGLTNWIVECERPGRIAAGQGTLDIDVPAGATLWFRHRLQGPVGIEYIVTPIAAGGPNDQVSDVNCFWMAQDPAAPGGSVLHRPRPGAFADYDPLTTYYAGLGGNRNTTSRFRRYVGTRGVRPLLPQHDLHHPEMLLQPNRPLHVQLIADGSRIALLRDGRPCFELHDPQPYRIGHFALRTTWSHLRVEQFRVWQLA